MSLYRKQDRATPQRMESTFTVQISSDSFGTQLEMIAAFWKALESFPGEVGILKPLRS